jgi:hypothetical protein
MTAAAQALKIVIARTSVAVNLYNPRKQLNTLNRLIASRIKCSMCSKRRSPEGRINIIADKAFTNGVFCPFLKAAGFCDKTKDNSLVVRLETNEFDVVRNAFDCLPNAGDPFQNFSIQSSDRIFDLGKEFYQLEDKPIVLNLRKACAFELRQSAIHELSMRPNEIEQTSRNELMERIMAHRIQNETFLGMQEVYRLVVNENNSFSITVRRGALSKACIRIYFSVAADTVVQNRGKRPKLVHKYSPIN